MASNSRRYHIIGGDYVRQGAPQADPLSTKYRSILPKQPVPTKKISNDPFAKVESPPNASTDNPADPLLKDTNLIEPQHNSTGTSKVISLMKSLWCDDYGHYNHKNMTILTSDMKRPIHCHASILSMVSTYIKDLIESSGSATGDHYSICLPDVSYETMWHFLERLYGFDDAECDETYVMCEMDYLVSALCVNFHRISPSVEFSRCSNPQLENRILNQENKNQESKKECDNFIDSHLVSDSYDQPPRDQNISEVSKFEKPGIENFSVNENTNQALCITCGAVFTSLDARLGIGRMTIMMKNHAENCSSSIKNEVLDEEDNRIDYVDNDTHDHVDSNLDEKYDIKIPNQMTVQCDKCPEVLRRKKSKYYYSLEFTLRKHQRAHHDENLPFKCDKCNYRALTDQTIKVHKGKWHNANRHPCGLGCGKAFTTKFSRDTHEKRWCSKSSVKEQLIQEEIADGRYTKELEKVKQRGNKFKHRMDRFRMDPKSLLNCELCGVSTGSQEELVIHMKDTHKTRSDKTKQSNTKPKAKSKEYIQCDKCPYFGKNIDQHLTSHHNPDLPHGCQKCGYRALNERSITMHTAKMHNEKKFHCKLGCGKMFDNQWYASFHEKRYCTNSKVKDELIKEEIENGKQELHKKRVKLVKKNHIKQMNLLKDQKECTSCHICGHLLSKGGFKLHFSKMHPNESIQT